MDTKQNAVVVCELSDVGARFDIFEKAVQSVNFEKVWRSWLSARRNRRRAIMLKSIDTTAIAVLNDAARRAFTGCSVNMTAGIQALYQTQAIVARVQAYNDFNARNDPYGEHDFGSFEFCDETVF